MPDFVLVVGDEESDEMMYEAVKDFSRGVKGEAPGTPETVATAAQSGQMSPGRRGGSYQVSAKDLLIPSVSFFSYHTRAEHR